MSKPLPLKLPGKSWLIFDKNDIASLLRTLAAKADRRGPHWKDTPDAQIWIERAETLRYAADVIERRTICGRKKSG